MSNQTTEASQSAHTQSSLRALSLAALGVVFGDIGTSPLYTLKTVLDVTSSETSREQWRPEFATAQEVPYALDQFDDHHPVRRRGDNPRFREP